MSPDVATFDRFARAYDYAMPRAREERLREGLSVATRERRRVLDLAGGPGRAVRALDPPAPLVVDAAPGMVRRAHRRGVPGIVGDAGRLPLADETVDAVLLVDALHHLPDWPATVREAARVLRPGGAFVVVDFDPSTLRGRALAAGEHLFGMESQFAGPDEVAALLSDAGLDASVVTTGFTYVVAGRA
ncbi:MAG: class I SAM-dependent methyltransferase [Haloarculaceae archaeon]